MLGSCCWRIYKACHSVDNVCVLCKVLYFLFTNMHFTYYFLKRKYSSKVASHKNNSNNYYTNGTTRSLGNTPTKQSQKWKTLLGKWECENIIWLQKKRRIVHTYKAKGKKEMLKKTYFVFADFSKSVFSWEPNRALNCLENYFLVSRPLGD